MFESGIQYYLTQSNKMKNILWCLLMRNISGKRSQHLYYLLFYGNRLIFFLLSFEWAKQSRERKRKKILCLQWFCRSTKNSIRLTWFERFRWDKRRFQTSDSVLVCVLLNHHAHIYIQWPNFPSGNDGPLNHFNFLFDWLNHKIFRALLGCRCCVFFFRFMKITAYFSNQLIIKVILVIRFPSLVVHFIYFLTLSDTALNPMDFFCSSRATAIEKFTKYQNTLNLNSCVLSHINRTSLNLQAWTFWSIFFLFSRIESESESKNIWC